MKNLLLVTLMTIISSCSSLPVSPLADSISGASYGTVQSRVQFRRTGNLLKVSYNVGSFDTISGPTYEFSHQDLNTLVYTRGGRRAVVSDITPDSVRVSFPGDGGTPQVFRPRGRNLGRRP